MFRALAKHCGDVVYLGPLPLYINLFNPIFKLIQKTLKRVINKKYFTLHNNFHCRLKGIFWTKKLSEGQFDLVFAAAASPEIAYLKTRLPIVYFSDATMALIWEYYPDFVEVIFKKEAESIERFAFQKSSLLVFSSQWAANSSINHYGVNPDKVRVIPFGANIDRVPSEISTRPTEHVCRLLFIGKWWERKGGKIAFNTLLELEKMGLEAKLIMCGCSAPKNFSHPNIKVVEWVKSIEDLLAWANFLLLPTRADCTPIVFSEAGAYGVPIISTDTGGISSIVTNSENGYLLDLSASAIDYARLIFDIWNDNQLYANLRDNSRKVYSERLNWDSWGKSMKHVITEAVKLET